MGIKSLDELREADERTLAFGPIGVGGQMTPEQAARFQQEAVSHPELAPAVPQRVRDCFSRLLITHAYGVLCYDFLTVAHDLAQLALEFALRERFMDFHGEAAEFRDEEGESRFVATAPFTMLQAEVRKHADKDSWRLVVHRTGETIRFDGMLDSLLRWAREEHLLRGQGNRALDRPMRNIRDYVAHGAGNHLLMPPDSARAISDVAEIINQLWGSATPGGRLYPAPLRREVQLIGWSPHGSVMAGPLELRADGPALDPQAIVKDICSALKDVGSAEDWIWVIVRAVPHDEALMRFDSLFEVTTYPCELLWGPGTLTDAAIWATREVPQGDTVDVLDRLFLVQHRQDCLYLPRSPEIALGLDDSERAGTWFLIRADNPLLAFGHARSVVTGSGCSRRGACTECPTETVLRGTWREAAAALAAERPEREPVHVADTRVSSLLRWPRYQQILEDGNWILGDR